MCIDSQFSDLSGPQHELLILLRHAVVGTPPDHAPFGWEEVLELARFHQVDHYLYPIVSAWDASCSPDPALLARWRNTFYGTVLKYARAEVQAVELLGALDRAGIKVVPLKGIWAAENLYEDGACRPMCDFDLLISPEQLDLARKVFVGLGYHTPDHFLDLQRDKHVHYKHSSHPMVIELHWKLWHEVMEAVGEFDSERMFDDLQDEILHGVPVHAFSPERQLIYFAQHILHHEISMPLRSYLDLALMIQKFSEILDPVKLENEAVAWRVPFGVRFILSVVCDLFELEPEGALSTFLHEMEACDRERKEAVAALVGMTSESGSMTPAMEACVQSSLFQRISLGVSRVFLPKSKILPAYPEAVSRYGLVGGYFARAKDLMERKGRLWRATGRVDSRSQSDLKNFQVRRELSAWIGEKDTMS